MPFSFFNRHVLSSLPSMWLSWLFLWLIHCGVSFMFFPFNTVFFRNKSLGASTFKECGEGVSSTSWKGTNCRDQNMWLWHMHYFELKAFWSQQMQKQAFPEIPLHLIKRRNFWTMRTAVNFLSWGSFVATKKTGRRCWDQPAEANCILHWSPSYIYLPQLPILGGLKPFPLSLLYKFIVLC